MDFISSKPFFRRLDWWRCYIFNSPRKESSCSPRVLMLSPAVVSWNRDLRRVVGGPVWIFSDYFEAFCSSASRLWHFILARLGLDAPIKRQLRGKSWYFCDLWHHMLRSFGFTTEIIPSPFYFLDLGAGALFLFSTLWVMVFLLYCPCTKM